MSAHATSFDEIVMHPPTAASLWVNWYPSDWHSSAQLKRLAQQLVANAPTRQDIPKILHDWICNHIYYDQDALNSDAYSTLAAADVLRERRGVCEGIANLAQALFLEAGIPCVKVWGVAIEEGQQWADSGLDLDRVNHTWNEYYMNGQWFPMDCTMDMGNVYADTQYQARPGRDDYLAPVAEWFSRTHIKLRGEEAWPEDIPDPWAVDEIQAFVDSGQAPLRLLSNYRAPVTGEEFAMLTGRAWDRETAPTRLEVAVFLAQELKLGEYQAFSYRDVEGCSQVELQSLEALRQAGIMWGDGENFFPSRALTRQETVLLAVRLNKE